MARIASNFFVVATIIIAATSPMLARAVRDRYPFGSKFTGDGTYYGEIPPGDGHCAIEHPLPDMYEGMIPMAVSLHDMYDDSAMCGACIVGFGTGVGSGKNPIKGTFRGFVSDSCAECAKGDLDFAMVGDGRWDIIWKFVQCRSGGDPQFIFEGSNEWYWKIQSRATTSPVKELWIDGEKATKTDDNFFTASEGPYYGKKVVRTTTVFGEKKKTKVSL